jgi:hypothetical protein
MAVPVSLVVVFGAADGGAWASRVGLVAQAARRIASTSDKSTVLVEPNLRLALCSFIVVPILLSAPPLPAAARWQREPVLLVPTAALVASLTANDL